MKKLKRQIATILLFSMIFSVISPAQVLAADITAKAEITGVTISIGKGGEYEDIIVNGQEVPDAPRPMEGN